MAERSTSIQVIERMAHLLDVIAREEPVSLKVLAAETGLHPSTAFRILSTLVEQGIATRSAEGAYRLGFKLLQWGGRVHSRIDLRGEAQEVMEWLRNQVGETVNLTVREGDEVIYIERATAKRLMRVEQVVGSRAPLHVTAVGKLMLGEGGEAECRAYATRNGLRRFTPNTVRDVEALIKEVHLARERGYALDNEEAELGVGCIGAPVHDAGGRITACLSISAPIERRQDEAWIPLVVEAAQRLSERLGYINHAPPL